MTDWQSDFIYPNEEVRIEQGAHVALHFEVSLENGVVIDSTFDRQVPVELTIGDESLLIGFEKVLMGLKAGDKRTAHLSADQAFGEYNPENIQRFSPSQFALVNDAPQVGMMLEFADKGKNAVVGVVSAITDDEIVVDFNHPLAGHHIIFRVQIFKVTPKGEKAVRLTHGELT